MTRQLLPAMLAFALAACGGGGTPSPSPAPQPAPTPSPPPDWTINGRVVEHGTDNAVAGASVDLGAGLAVLQTDADGRFEVEATVLPSVLRADIRAPGFIPRQANVRAVAGARDVTLDIVRNRAPFSLTFYRELARDAYESKTLTTLRRLTGDPNVYVRTVDQDGKPIEPEVLRVVTSTIPRSVDDWSAGSLHVAAFETGTETRPRTSGWIIVNILRDRKSEWCGDAFVGVDDGLIRLWDDVCSCGSTKISPEVVAHEVGHAMGFWHVRDKHALMSQMVLGCPRGILTSTERYHAALAYSRARGNVDQDSDPTDATPLATGEPGVRIVN